MIGRELEERAIREGPDAWFENYGVVKNDGGDLVGFGTGHSLRANYLQQQIADAICWLRSVGLPIRLLVLKPRQKGCWTF
jgi:hypothetical protein